VLVIVVSANTDPGIADKVRALGAGELMAEPIDLDLLLTSSLGWGLSLSPQLLSNYKWCSNARMTGNVWLVVVDDSGIEVSM
jgi:hypothetical protein